MAKTELEKLGHKVLRPLRHDEKTHGKGSTVALTAKEAAPLVKSGVVAKPEPAPEQKPAT